ncbi:MAG TPA: sigma-70 family RNA polymerase sigma factor [Cytophagales bacterium]|nr:sigma-70 family RNA polymerase sigma factor [Cytophagales bacterium]
MTHSLLESQSHTEFDIQSYQRTLLPYAYNILGVIEDAEDVVQEVLIKWLEIDKTQIANQKSFLVRSVINKAINEKKSQLVKRKSYPGNWLPQPISTLGEATVDREKVLSYAYLVMLEVLKEKERSVFILKEVFDYEHSEIGELLNITTENSRQIFKRAKDKLNLKGSVKVKPNIATSNLEKFIRAFKSADVKQLGQLLTDDIAFTSDGGEKIAASKNVIYGKESVIKLIAGIRKKFYPEIEGRVVEVNGDIAILYYWKEQIKACQILCFKEDKVENIYHIVNPDKLKAFALGGD